MPTTIYVINCEDDCWYVGKTSRPEIRIPGHFRNVIDGWTPRWLIKHPPLKLVESYILSADNMSEDAKTEELISIYGIDKVAGGKYVHRRSIKSE
jgi:predicted GIY-YIG superfamily endonuclease